MSGCKNTWFPVFLSFCKHARLHRKRFPSGFSVRLKHFSFSGGPKLGVAPFFLSWLIFCARPKPKNASNCGKAYGSAGNAYYAGYRHAETK